MVGTATGHCSTSRWRRFAATDAVGGATSPPVAAQPFNRRKRRDSTVVLLSSTSGHRGMPKAGMGLTREVVAEAEEYGMLRAIGNFHLGQIAFLESVTAPSDHHRYQLAQHRLAAQQILGIHANHVFTVRLNPQ